jgi:hypothetical protein
MEQKERKYFADIAAALDADSADFAVAPNSWVNMENCRTGTTDAGKTEVVEAIGSTVLRSTPQVSQTFYTIGAATDDENNRILYFKKNTTGPWDRILCWDIDSETEYIVLLSSQVEGGLNFADGIIHSARVVNGMLYWCEGTDNQPRKINIDSGIKLNQPSYDTDAEPYPNILEWDEITLIKKPAPLAPNIQKSTDVSFDNNFIANESFMFAYQYTWYDNENTVLGTYSPTSRLNDADDTYNSIVVTMDNREAIPNTVRYVSLVARFSNTNIAKIIKTWDREDTTDEAEIDDQNDGVTPLQFTFYNNITGETIAQDLVLKPFDRVPRFAQTIETARNRIFLGNCVHGYNSPLSTSLAIVLNSGDVAGSTTVYKSLIEGRGRASYSTGATARSRGAWYVYLSAAEAGTEGYYEVNGTAASSTSEIVFTIYTVSPSLDPINTPTTVSLAGLTYRGLTQSAAMTASLDAGYTANFAYTFSTSSTVIPVTGLTVAVTNLFKTKSQYKAGVVFYDFAMRKCGVVTNDGLVFEIPARDYDFTTGTLSATWSLSNTNALTEIPDWAYYYSVVRTLNLRTRYFISSFDKALRYATKDSEGAYVFTNTTYVAAAVGIAIDTTAMVRAGLGYVYTEGDIAILTRDDDVEFQLPVIGQSGKYIIVKAENIGDLAVKRFVYEVYTPYQTGEQEPFFEVGELYRILDPETSARRYETLSGDFLPDAYSISRNFDSVTYMAEAMSPNDLYFDRWDTDAGKANFVTKLGEQTKDHSISFSNTYVAGTALNGLSTFDLFDEETIPLETGSIKKLQLTSKVADEIGSVMLAICTRETASIYIGEVQLVGSDSNAPLVQTNRVVGSVNILKGSYGTNNPESVVEHRGNVYWLDINNGKYIQYSLNGLFPISNYKMTRFWKLFSDQFQSMTSEEIEALGTRPYVVSAVDPHHNELLISIPKLLATPPKGYLPDYESTIYPFDIWDGQAKTMVYKLDLGLGNPHWQGSYSFNADYIISLQDKLFSFKTGHLYEHNSTTDFNEFYGTRYKSKVMFISNSLPNVPKVYNNISVEANDGTLLPSLVYMRTEVPYIQGTDLVDFDWRNLEGKLYATFYRNKIQPTATGYSTDSLLTGEKMRGMVAKVLLEFTVTTEPLELKFVTLGFNISRGHREPL